MLFIKLIRFFKGVVCFTLTGGFAERFLNLCIRAGIPVFNTSRARGALYACTTARCYRRLRPIAKKTGVRMRLHEKRGLPFLLRRYHKRVGLLLGAGLFALFLAVMSRFLWAVELEGNDTLSDEYLLGQLRACGVYEGAYISRIDVRRAENEMLLSTPALSWIAINIKSSTAQVEIKERDMAPEMIDVDAPCNVVAARTGQIVEMQVYEGQPVLKVGDTVQEGELIVSGFMEGASVKRGYLTHARARVVAEFMQEVDIAVPLRQELREPTGKVVKKRSLRLFGLEIPLHLTGAPDGPSDKTTQEKQPTVLGLRFPLQLITDTYQMQAVQEVTCTEAEAREQALEKLRTFERDFATIGEITSKTASGEVKDGQYLVHAQFILRQDIARQKAIQVEEGMDLGGLKAQPKLEGQPGQPPPSPAPPAANGDGE